MTKRAEDMGIRSEILAIMTGKNKTLTKLRLMQLKAFQGLKKYMEWRKYKKILTRRSQADFKLKLQRQCFQGWVKDYKKWKVNKDQEHFEASVKSELQSISAQYSKEIETL
jgi:hypothetical protein